MNKSLIHQNNFLERAFWDTPKQVVVLLKQDWLEQEDKLPLFWNEPEQPIEHYERAQLRRYGEWAGYYVERGWLYFLVQPSAYPYINFSDERLFVSGDFNNWAGQNDTHWELTAHHHEDKLSYMLRLPISACLTDQPRFFKFVTAQGHWLEPSNKAPNRITDEQGCANFELDPQRTGAHVFYLTVTQPCNPLVEHKLCWIQQEHSEACPVDFTDLFFRASTDLELGAIVDVNQKTTTFRLFAPRANAVTLEYSKSLAKNAAKVTLKLERIEDYVWQAIIHEDLCGVYYSYRLEGEYDFFDPSVPVLDPYAKACVGPQGPGIVVGPQPSAPTHFQPPAWHDLVVLEGHVRDLIAKAPIKMSNAERLGFSGLSKWVSHPDGYLKKLGINALELQPIQQFDGHNPKDYHWGYMSVNYFAPSTHYCLDPKKASGLQEVRQLVDACHQAGIAVIMDVVYNHIGSPNGLYLIDKDYYFETTPDGNLTNFSGCGNDLRAHTPMGRRLIIDSLKHWVTTVGVDGFRFDLAELIGVDVLKDVEKALKAIKPSIILIAEPWSFKGHIALALRDTGYCSWNDGYRDFLAEYVCGQGNVDGLTYFMGGSTGHLAAWAGQTLNYTESHDDYAWIDRITQNAKHNGDWPTAQDTNRTHLMFAILLASLGIPMLASGQDFMRSKFGNPNTYQNGPLNALDYERQARFPATHTYVRSWIHWRLSDKGHLMRFDGKPSAGFMRVHGSEGNSAAALLYNADASRGSSQVLFAINPHLDTVEIPLPGLNPQHFRQIADHERFDSQGLTDACFSWQDECLRLPPLSCGLWEKL